jgi:hypothetical protein
MSRKSILDTVAPVLKNWDKKPCPLKNPIRLAERVSELDTTVTIQVQKPKHVTGLAASGKSKK